MVEEDSIAGEQIVALTEVHRDPVRVDLGYAIRAAGMEGGGLPLRDFRNLAEHLRAAGLIEPGLQLDLPDRLQDSHRPHAGNVARIFRYVEAHPHMALRGEVVYLVRPDSVEQ